MAASCCPARVAAQPCAARVLLPAWRLPKRSVESRIKASSDFLRSSARTIFGCPNIGSVSVGSASAQRAGAEKTMKDKRSVPMEKLRHNGWPADLVLSVINISIFELISRRDSLCDTGFPHPKLSRAILTANQTRMVHDDLQRFPAMLDRKSTRLNS